MLTVKQVARRLGVSDSLIYEWCAAGILPHYRFGRQGKRGKILVDETELEAFRTSCRQERQCDADAIPELRHIQLG